LVRTCRYTCNATLAVDHYRSGFDLSLPRRLHDHPQLFQGGDGVIPTGTLSTPSHPLPSSTPLIHSLSSTPSHPLPLIHSLSSNPSHPLSHSCRGPATRSTSAFSRSPSFSPSTTPLRQCQE
jgi:hypothetical protein